MSQVTFNWKQINTGDLKNDAISIFTSDQAMDWLYRDTKVEYRIKTGVFSIMINPYPKCCGMRVVNCSIVPHDASKKDIEFWNTLVCQVVALDSKWNYPGLYCFATNGSGGESEETFKPHARTTNEVFNFMDKFATSRQFHKNPIMSSVIRHSQLKTGNDASKLGEPFLLPKEFKNLSPF